MMYHPEDDVKCVYCSKHVSVAVRWWGADYPNQDGFPELYEEPTSYVPGMARREDVSGYQVIECPECESDAFAKKRLAKDPEFWTYACRNCQKGSRILTQHSNYGVAWDRVREWVKNRDGGACVTCGSESELHVHHKKKLVYFQTTAEANRPENLLTLCKVCHREREEIHEPGRLNGTEVAHLKP